MLNSHASAVLECRVRPSRAQMRPLNVTSVTRVASSRRVWCDKDEIHLGMQIYRGRVIVEADVPFFIWRTTFHFFSLYTGKHFLRFYCISFFFHVFISRGIRSVRKEFLFLNDVFFSPVRHLCFFIFKAVLKEKVMSDRPTDRPTEGPTDGRRTPRRVKSLRRD